MLKHHNLKYGEIWKKLLYAKELLKNGIYQLSGQTASNDNFQIVESLEKLLARGTRAVFFFSTKCTF